MSDLVKTIRINELPKATTIQDNDSFLIEDGSTTRKISGADLLAKVASHTEENGGYVKASSKGVANGVAPLNSNNKIANTYLTYGTTTGTIFDGGKGQAVETKVNTHVADTSIHVTSTEKSNIHTHSNKSVLDSITQAKINAWDAGTGGGSGGTTSLADLGVTATATELNVLDGITATTAELNYMDGVTSNVQNQLNGKAASSHGTHVTYSTTAPVMDGTASVGSANTVARGDHKHPSDTSKADVNHTQSASTITAGTLGGQIVTPAGTDYDTNRVRNMVLVNADPQVGTESTYVNGTIICVYE